MVWKAPKKRPTQKKVIGLIAGLAMATSVVTQPALAQPQEPVGNEVSVTNDAWSGQPTNAPIDYGDSQAGSNLPPVQRYAQPLFDPAAMTVNIGGNVIPLPQVVGGAVLALGVIVGIILGVIYGGKSQSADADSGETPKPGGDGSGSPSTEKPEAPALKDGEIQVNPKAKGMETWQATDLFGSLEGLGDTKKEFIIRQSELNSAEVSEGSVLSLPPSSSLPEGRIIRVASVDDSSPYYAKVTVEKGDLGDILENTGGMVALPVVGVETTRLDPGYGVSVTQGSHSPYRDRASFSGEESFSEDIVNVNLARHIPKLKGLDTATVKSTITATSTLEVEVKSKDIKQLKTGVDVSSRTEIDLKKTGHFEDSVGGDLFGTDKTFTFMAGPVPVWLVASFDVKWEVNLEIDAEARFNPIIEGGIGAGVTYKDGVIEPYKEVQPLTQTNPNVIALTGSATLEPSLPIEFGLKLYDLIGATGGITLGARFGAQADFLAPSLVCSGSYYLRPRLEYGFYFPDLDFDWPWNRWFEMDEEDLPQGTDKFVKDVNFDPITLLDTGDVCGSWDLDETLNVVPDERLRSQINRNVFGKSGNRQLESITKKQMESITQLEVAEGADLADLNYTGLEFASNLKELTIRGATKFPEQTTKLSNLKSLKLTRSTFSEIPESISNLSGLETFKYDGSNLTRLPDGFSKLMSLKYLKLSDNSIEELPDFLGYFADLEIFEFYGDGVTRVPSSLGNLTEVHEFSLDGNGITSVPESLGNLHRVRTMSLVSRNLRSIPKSLGNLNLQKLYLSYTTEYPSFIKGLIIWK